MSTDSKCQICGASEDEVALLKRSGGDIISCEDYRDCFFRVVVERNALRKMLQKIVDHSEVQS